MHSAPLASQRFRTPMCMSSEAPAPERAGAPGAAVGRCGPVAWCVTSQASIGTSAGAQVVVALKSAGGAQAVAP